MEKSAEEWKEEGDKFYDAEDFEKATYCYKKLFDLVSDITEIAGLAYVGLSFRLMEKWDEAIKSFDKMLNIDPNYVEAYLHKADVLICLQKQKEALDEINKCISCDPKFAKAYPQKARALGQLKRREEEREALMTYLTFDPEDAADVYMKIATSFQESGKNEEALDNYNKSLPLQEDRSIEQITVIVRKGQIFLDLYRWEEALNCFDKALDVIKDDVDLYKFKAKALEKLFRNAEAAECLKKAERLRLKKTETTTRTSCCNAF